MYKKKEFMTETNLSSKKEKMKSKINSNKKTPEQSFRGLMDQYMISQIKPEHKKDAISRLEKNREEERVQKELKNRLNKISHKIGDFVTASLSDINNFFKKSFIKLTLKNSGKTGKKIAYVSDMNSKNVKAKPLKSVNKQWNDAVNQAYNREHTLNEAETQKQNLLVQSSKALHKIRHNLLGWESMKTIVSPIISNVLGGPTGYTVRKGIGYFGRTSYDNMPPLECLGKKEKTRQLMFDNLISNEKRKEVEYFLKSFGIKKPENRTTIELKSMCEKLINMNVPKNKKDIVEKFGKKHENSPYDADILSKKIKNSINVKIDKFLEKHFVFNEKLTPMTPILYNDQNVLEANKINKYIDTNKMKQLFGGFETFWNKTYNEINPQDNKDNTPEVDIKDISLHNIETYAHGSSFDAVKGELNKNETKNENIFIQLGDVSSMKDLMRAEIYSKNNNGEVIPTYMSSISSLPNGIYKIIDDLDDIKNVVGFLDIKDEKISLLNDKKQEHNIEGPSSFSKTGRPLNWALNGNILTKTEYETHSLLHQDNNTIPSNDDVKTQTQVKDIPIADSKLHQDKTIITPTISSTDNDDVKTQTQVRDIPISDSKLHQDRIIITPTIPSIDNDKEPDLITDPLLLDGHKRLKAEAIIQALRLLQEYDDMTKKHDNENTQHDLNEHLSHLVAETTAEAFMNM
jgi:hypothetical protein